MTGTDFPILFPSKAVAAKSQSAGKGSAAAQMWWGRWGSNPRPADYEKYARPQYALDLQRCHAFVAMNARMALRFPGAPVHAPVHTEPSSEGYRRDAA
jgi:hypothetical protein